MKHFINAAETGHDESLESIKSANTKGLVTKEVFANILCTRKNAVDETKKEKCTKD
jgi:hypothetical protein